MAVPCPRPNGIDRQFGYPFSNGADGSQELLRESISNTAKCETQVGKGETATRYCGQRPVLRGSIGSSIAIPPETVLPRKTCSRGSRSRRLRVQKGRPEYSQMTRTSQRRARNSEARRVAMAWHRAALLRPVRCGWSPSAGWEPVCAAGIAVRHGCEPDCRHPCLLRRFREIPYR